jgi:hypothetical protein
MDANTNDQQPLSDSSTDRDGDRRRQTSITGHVRDTFQRINFQRVFLCNGCKKMWLGKDLYKNQKKEYVCLDCAQPVQDVTDSPLGISFLNIVLPNWKAQ